MRFVNELMSDPNVQKKKINTLKRSKRNSWAEKIELDIRKISPYPISYDVTCNHPVNFTEYTYTELLGGMYLQSHSIDINTRLLQLASEEHSDDMSTHDKLKELSIDKYSLGEEIPKRFQNVEDIVFMPGNNIADIASVDIIGRVCSDEKVMVKPHPLTAEGFLAVLARTCGGWNRLIPMDLSGVYFLQNCKRVYVTTNSEISISGFILGKEVINVSAYKYESAGVYYPISRILFNSENPIQSLVNIVNCKWSGLLFPWQEDYIERAEAFYTKTLELREIYKPLHGPINWPHTVIKPDPRGEPKNIEQKKQHNSPEFNKKIEYQPQ